jgi:putative transposase
VLVLIGATEDGSKELLAVVDGYRESSQSWRELRGQVKRLGLSGGPKLAIGDGPLGFLDRFAGRIWPNCPGALLGA